MTLFGRNEENNDLAVNSRLELIQVSQQYIESVLHDIAKRLGTLESFVKKEEEKPTYKVDIELVKFTNAISWLPTKSIITSLNKSKKDFNESDYLNILTAVLSHINNERRIEIINEFWEDVKKIIPFLIAENSISLKTLKKANALLHNLRDTTVENTNRPRTLYDAMSTLRDQLPEALILQIESSLWEDQLMRFEWIKFNDLVLIDNRSLQTLLREVSNDEILTALYKAPNNVVEAFLNAMSQRAAKMIKEDLEMLKDVSEDDVELARAHIVKASRRLYAEWSTILLGKVTP